jgi:uncharacterized protein YndB with AHSA1/START domain
MARIAHLVRIRATPEEIFRRVATTAGIAEWFTVASSPDYVEGGTLELRFGEERVSFAITELTEPSRIVWHCTSRENSWFDTDIVFELVAQGDRTLVRFDHRGWPEVSDRFRDCSMSWAYFLESLRTLLEEGRGTPESLAPPCEGASALDATPGSPGGGASAGPCTKRC